MREGLSDYYVYVLFHHVTGIPFYVGKGRRFRMQSHMSDLRGTADKVAVIRDALSLGMSVPAVKIREGLTEIAALRVEEAFIKAIGRAPQGPLLNGDDGGRGGNPSSQVRRRLAELARASRLGKPLTEATRLKIKRAAIGRAPSDACREAALRAVKGAKVPRELALRRASWKRGVPHTAEHTAAISKALKGTPPSEATRVAHRIFCEQRAAAAPKKICEMCGALFKPRRSVQRFCGMSCSGKNNKAAHLSANDKSKGQLVDT